MLGPARSEIGISVSRVDCAQSSTSTVHTNGIRLLLQFQLDRLSGADRNQHRGPAAVRQFQIHRHLREIRTLRFSIRSRASSSATATRRGCDSKFAPIRADAEQRVDGKFA